MTYHQMKIVPITIVVLLFAFIFGCCKYCTYQESKLQEYCTEIRKKDRKVTWVFVNPSGQEFRSTNYLDCGNPELYSTKRYPIGYWRFNPLISSCCCCSVTDDNTGVLIHPSCVLVKREIK